jgi:RNA polymerase sigma-70 factor (ECF subfamily)
MFINEDTYTLLAETVNGVTYYTVSFVDGEGEEQEVDVTYPIYQEFLKFVKTERNLKRWSERHEEYSDLTEESLYRRALHPPKSTEENVFEKIRIKQIREVIQGLSKIQRRRFVLYHEFGMTCSQIAEIEGCCFTTVSQSIRRAEEKIKKTVNSL